MFRTILSLALAFLLVLGFSGAPAYAAQVSQDAQNTEKVRQKVAKVGTGEKARVTVRMKSGAKIKGFISQAGADNFTVRDRNTGDPTVIAYGDALKVEDNRGHSTLRNVLIGVGVGAGALLAILLITFAALED